MSASNEIIPAILPKDKVDLEKKVVSLPKEISYFHFDVLEQDIWGDEIKQDFEVHLMVEKPEEIVETWIKRGAKRIIAHKVVETKGIEFGIALKLMDPIENIEKADFVHLMSIAEIGEQGHPLDERIFDRIKEVKEKFPNIKISVDGGINVGNYKKLIESGADTLVVGSGFQELWASLQET